MLLTTTLFVWYAICGGKAFPTRDSKQEPELKKKMPYDWGLSTFQNYESTTRELIGSFVKVRQKLDLAYHKYYVPERQIFQDQIVKHIIGNKSCNYESPFIFFLAGQLGSGKSYSLQYLGERFDWSNYILVEFDMIRQMLPEYHEYNSIDKNEAGYKTQKECGYIAEILTGVALRKKCNIVIDGTLQNFKYYSGFFEKLRKNHPKYRIGILHVTSSLCHHRVQLRARTVPREVLLKAEKAIPKSVEKLKMQADLYIQVNNDFAPTFVRAETNKETSLSPPKISTMVKAFVHAEKRPPPFSKRSSL